MCLGDMRAGGTYMSSAVKLPGAWGTEADGTVEAVAAVAEQEPG